jgi:sulfite reductase alpha subunit-like flavoprotein
VRHVAFDLTQSNLTYAPGDVLSVHPRNASEDVDAFLALYANDDVAAAANGVHGDVVVTALRNADAGDTRECELAAAVTESSPLTVRQLLRTHLDINGMPRRYFFFLLSFFATNEMEAERLREFGSAEYAEELYRYCMRERRSYTEVLFEFPSARPPLPYLLHMIPRLQPRLFSIASSLRANSTPQAHICMAVVEYATPLKRRKRGVLTAYLASLAASTPRRPVRVFVGVKKGSFVMPLLSTPLVMVGPGTGIAPFRAMTQERTALIRDATAAATAATAAAGTDVISDEAPTTTTITTTVTATITAAATTTETTETTEAIAAEATVTTAATTTAATTTRLVGDTHVGAAGLFFGCRGARSDFHYGDEWPSHVAAGALDFVAAAFSRDGAADENKTYVQHRLLEPATAARVWRLLSDDAGGVFFVAGNSKNMPKDVRAALATVAATCGNLSADDSERWLKRMEAQGRYVVETWA